METLNRLKEARERKRISAAKLAARVGISRQTIYAIEGGAYVPNTSIALMLARELETPVEELFALAVPDEPPPIREAEAVGDGLDEGGLVRLCTVGKRTVAVPSATEQLLLPEADGVVAGPYRGRFRIRCAGMDAFDDRVLIAGCDPGLSLLAAVLRGSHVEAVIASAPSGESLERLRTGSAHIAGMHLRDSSSGEYNVPILRRIFPRTALYTATFASWREGLLVQPGNPKNIRSIADLARADVSIVNRQEDAGSRHLLDRGLEEAGVSPTEVRGYGRILRGHLPAAMAVAHGDADCCIATEAAARLFGLDFVPLATERFDLVTFKKYLDLSPVQAVFDTLSRSPIRCKLEGIAGYDVSETGSQQS